MKKKLVSILSVGLLLICISNDAYASDVGIHFEGQILETNHNGVDLNWSSLEAHFKAGDIICGNLYYQSDAKSFWEYTDFDYKEVIYKFTGMDVSIHDFTANSNGGTFTVFDAFAPFSIQVDQYATWTNSYDGLIGSGLPYPIFSLGFGVYHDNDFFTGNDLPISASDFGDLYDSKIFLLFVDDILNPSQAANFSVDAKITLLQDIRPIPIPSTIWLLGSGLAGIVGLKKRRGEIVDSAVLDTEIQHR
jgi:hypothetical protein